MSRRGQAFENKPSQLALEVEQELIENSNTDVFNAMMQKASANCFLACTNPTSGKLLSGTEKNCLTKCLKSYIESQGIVGDTYYKNIEERTQVSYVHICIYLLAIFPRLMSQIANIFTIILSELTKNLLNTNIVLFIQLWH
jgi:hypothetical protein